MTTDTKPILPGATLGVLGSGQLGRMFAIAGAQMGYHIHVYSPDNNTPAGEVAVREFSAPYEDEDALIEFAKSVDVVTFEFENVPSAVSTAIGNHSRIRPSASVLNISQNRLREKSTLRDAGLPVPEFRPIHSREELQSAVVELGTPSVVKTASSGYDGKGQAVIRSDSDCSSVWESLNTNEAILEQFVDFEREISVVGARNPQGEFAVYRPFDNTHQNHILDVTLCPASLDPQVENQAIEIARTVFETLDVIGVLCVEMFVTRTGDLLINELAPRPHNSGHLTIDAHKTSQFEQQVRAICGLPLGSVDQLAPAAMVNLLGDLWNKGEPAWDRLCGKSSANLHLYGKAAARPGRKMGHITTLADSTSAAADVAFCARHSLAGTQPRGNTD